MAKYMVRFGTMKPLGVFSARGGSEFERDNIVVVRTNRGLESGDVLATTGPDFSARLFLCQRRVSLRNSCSGSW